MSVIFFDGFEARNQNGSLYSYIDTNYWARSDGAAVYGTDTGWGRGITLSATAGYVVFLQNIGTHTNKKLYLGLRWSIDGYQTGFPSNPPLLTIYNSSNSAVLDVSITQQNLAANALVGLAVSQNGQLVTTYSMFNSLAAPITVRDGFSDYFFRLDLSPRPVFEFEFDLVNNTVALRYQNVELFNTNSQSLTTVSAFGAVAKIGLHGGSSSSVLYDIYLVDDTGTFANTWLGNSFSVQPLSATQQNLTVNSDAQLIINGAAQPSALASTALAEDSSGSTGFIRLPEVGDYFAASFSDPPTSFSPEIYYPLIAGLRLDSVARGASASLPSAYKFVFYEPFGASLHEMGATIPLSSGAYAKKPAQFVNTNPDSGGQWDIPTINAASFGVKNVATS